MAIVLLSVFARHDRRVRLVFSNTLAASAFTSVSYYAVTNVDGAGSSPVVNASLVVPNSPNVAELVLASPLVTGGSYTVTANAVPAIDATVTPTPSSQPFTWGAPVPDANAEVTQLDLGALVFGTDVVWTGKDFLLTPAGDLATVSGVANFQGAINRRLLGRYGLPWRPRYGLQGDRFVNGPRPSASTLKGALIRQARQDDRVSAASAAFSFNDANDPTSAIFNVQVTPIGNSQPIGLTVPAGH